MRAIEQSIIRAIEKRAAVQTASRADRSALCESLRVLRALCVTLPSTAKDAEMFAKNARIFLSDLFVSSCRCGSKCLRTDLRFSHGANRAHRASQLTLRPLCEPIIRYNLVDYTGVNVNCKMSLKNCWFREGILWFMLWLGFIRQISKSENQKFQ